MPSDAPGVASFVRRRQGLEWRRWRPPDGYAAVTTPVVVTS